MQSQLTMISNHLYCLHKLKWAIPYHALYRNVYQNIYKGGKNIAALHDCWSINITFGTNIVNKKNSKWFCLQILYTIQIQLIGLTQ